jgi:DNA-binding transcriptional LysR family regulator
MSQIDDMGSFVRVAELSSFTQAAQSLGLPKASVSAAVQRLEALLGTRLLHRTTRRVQVTQDGQAFYERCKDLLDDLDELRVMFAPGPAQLRGRLRVDMPLATARHTVLPRLGEFLALHPALEVELSSTDRRVDLVREGFDCVLRVGLLADSGLVARPLGHYRMVNVASPAYVQAHGRPQDLAELLARHRLVHYAPVLGSRAAGFEHVDAAGTVHFEPMPGALTVNNSESYMAACLAGLGIVQVPRWGVGPAIEEGRLVELLPAHVAAPMPVSLLYASRRQLPRRVQAFMAWLAELMAPQLDGPATPHVDIASKPSATDPAPPVRRRSIPLGG